MGIFDKVKEVKGNLEAKHLENAKDTATRASDDQILRGIKNAPNDEYRRIMIKEAQKRGLTY